MFDDKNKKKKGVLILEDEALDDEALDDEALDLDDLENVAGGRMRDEAVTNDTTDVSADTKRNI